MRARTPPHQHLSLLHKEGEPIPDEILFRKWLLWGIYNSKPRLSADTSTSESEEVENPRLEKKALSPVGGGQAKGPTPEKERGFVTRARKIGKGPTRL